MKLFEADCLLFGIILIAEDMPVDTEGGYVLIYCHYSANLAENRYEVHRLSKIGRRFDFIQGLMLVMIAGIFGLIGYIVWD
ncbi:MAG: hypothetical protein GQ559_08785 [Desulfobulbaceae bacterium]|nr:hypothetical protein [Desulfobulbaceae bacterium]